MAERTLLHRNIENIDSTGARDFVEGREVYRIALSFKSVAQERFSIRLAKNGLRAFSPHKLIEKAVRNHKDKIAVAWSGGRCSTAMLHMALRVNPEIKVMFVNTGVEFPEIIRFVEKMSREWNLNLTVVKPEKTFWDIVKENGFPGIRTPGDSTTKRKSRDVPLCCKWLKEKPVKKFSLETGTEAFITGMRAAESRVRALVIRQKGAQFYFVKSQGVWKYHPLAFWRTKQVSDYIVENNIPLSPIYKKIDRSGCWPCTAFIGWRENLMSANPKLYEALNKMMTNEKMLDHFYRSKMAPCADRG